MSTFDDDGPIARDEEERAEEMRQTPRLSATQAIAVGVALAESAVTGPCPYEVGRERAREAAKTLAALSVELTKAVPALARIADTLHGWRNGYQGGTYFISGPELEKLADEMRVLLAALGLDPAPHGGASE